MKKELPSMYQNDIKKEITNSMNTYYSKTNFMKPREVAPVKESTNKYVISAKKKVYNIFKANKYEYIINTKIEYNDGRVEERKIIGQDKQFIITLDKEKINIDDIKDINTI